MQVYVPNKESSNVYRAAHNGTDLLVGMKGGVYVYLNVPAQELTELLTSDSAGQYMNKVIKPSYEVRKATDEETLAMATTEPQRIVQFKYVTETQFGVPGGQPLRNEAGDRLIVPHQNNWGQPVDLKFLDPNVTVKYAKDGDAAFDLMASSVANPVTDWALEFPIHLEPGQHVLIGTGIAMKLPIGLAGLVTPRSGLAKKLRVSVVNTPGLIDSGYTGEIGALVENRGDETYVINQYDRIAQYLIVPAITPIFRVVDELDQTERGANGFGSTGTEKVVL